MDESMLINGVLRSVLGGRRKKSKKALRYLSGGRGGSLWTNPQVLLTAAGVAWGLYETLQQKTDNPIPGSAPVGPPPGAPAPVMSSPGVPSQPLPPLPVITPPASSASDEALRIVRLAISAAYADGVVSDDERASILEQARSAGVEQIIGQELAQPRRLTEIVRGVTDDGQRAALYVLAFGILRGDEQPNGAERIYLATLAHHLNLDPKQVRELEQRAEKGIDDAAGGE